MKKYREYDLEEAIHDWEYVIGYAKFFRDELLTTKGATIHKDYLKEKTDNIKRKMENIMFLHERNNEGE